MTTEDATAKPGELVVVTGMTGAGRSTAAKELEDLGYYVIDNLPPGAAHGRGPARRREQGAGPAGRPRDRRPLRRVLRLAGRQPRARARPAGTRRWSSSRPATRCWCAARRPRAARTRSRVTAGCSTGCSASARCWPGCAATPTWSSTPRDFNVHQLTDRIADEFGTPLTVRLKVSVVSFGFKYGIPVDTDFVADMRFLPNPHWIPELRPHTGLDPEVADYVLGAAGCRGVPGALGRADRRRRGGLPRRGQAVRAGGDRLHRRQAPQCHRDRGGRPPAPGRAASRPGPTTATWGRE